MVYNTRDSWPPEYTFCLDVPINIVIACFMKKALLSFIMYISVRYRWRSILPYYSYLPFAEVRNIRKCIRIMDQVIFDIMNEKRKLIESGKGLTQPFHYNCKYVDRQSTEPVV